MIRNVFIASCEDITKGIIKSCVQRAVPGTQIIDCSKDNELSYHLRRDDGGIIFFDKYYLGYRIEEQIGILKRIYPRIRICFCETGEECSRFFGYRVHKLEIAGFISHIDVVDDFTCILRNVIAGQNYYPPEVTEGMENCEQKNESRCCSKVSPREVEIATLLAEGKTVKEISSILGIAEGTVSIHLNRLRRKVGAHTRLDYVFLNAQFVRFSLRSLGC